MPTGSECVECKRRFDPENVHRKAILVKGLGGANVYLCTDCYFRDTTGEGKYSRLTSEWWKIFNLFWDQSRGKWPHPNCPATKQLFSDSRHIRKDFLFKGEGWGCFLENAPSYDTLSGETSHKCEKRGEFHFRLPWDAEWGLRGSSSMLTNCAIVCAKHSRVYLATPGLVTLKLFER